MTSTDELTCIVVVFLVWLLVSLLESWKGVVEKRPNERNTYIDGLRAILALFVVAHHQIQVGYFLKSGSLYMAEISKVNKFLGPWSVSMFFALTAYLFTSKLLGDQVHQNSIRYYNRLFAFRCVRLIPVALVSTVIGFILLSLSQFNKLSLFTKPELTSLFKFAGFASSSIFGKSVVPSISGIESWEGTVLFGPHWSLHYEWVFYFTLPFLGLFTRLKSSVVVIFLWCSLGILVARFTNDSHYLEFLPGVIVAVLSRINRFNGVGKNKIFGYFCFALLLISIFVDRHKLLIVSNTLLLFAIVAQNRVMAFMSKHWLTNIGERTYSIYLLHVIPLYITAKICLLTHIDVESLTQIGTVQFFFPAVYVVQTVAVMVLSAICYRYIERPALLGGRGLVATLFSR